MKKELDIQDKAAVEAQTGLRPEKSSSAGKSSASISEHSDPSDEPAKKNRTAHAGANKTITSQSASLGCGSASLRAASRRLRASANSQTRRQMNRLPTGTEPLARGRRSGRTRNGTVAQAESGDDDSDEPVLAGGVKKSHKSPVAAPQLHTQPPDASMWASGYPFAFQATPGPFYSAWTSPPPAFPTTMSPSSTFPPPHGSWTYNP